MGGDEGGVGEDVLKLMFGALIRAAEMHFGASKASRRW
jgi:hypothetical protein